MTACGRLKVLGTHDLPDRFDPVTVKELRQNLRRTTFVAPFLGVHVLAAVAMVAEFRTGASRGVGEGAFLVFTSGPLWLLISAVCIGILPLGGLVMMREELEEGNHELLQLTKLGRWRVVFGKLATLWGLSALTLVSLLPYVVVRYLVGGIEWWREMTCVLTVLGAAAVVGAGAIGASSFRGLGARAAVFLLYLGSMLIGCGIPMAVAGGMFGTTGWKGLYYHLTTLAAVATYSLIGISLGRSRMRLALLTYEVKPSGAMIGVLIFAPFFIGLVTAMSVGFGGWIGLGLAALVAARVDTTPTSSKPRAPLARAIHEKPLE